MLSALAAALLAAVLLAAVLLSRCSAIGDVGEQLLPLLGTTGETTLGS
jgi:hypothetical protein